MTETGSVYVVVPVPPNVGGGPTKPLPMYGSDQKPPVLDSTAATPRLANGKPNVTGSWRSGSKFFIWRYGNRRCAPTQLAGCSEAWNQTLDFEFEAASRFGPNRPLYKPENWDKIQQLDMWTNKEDPVMTCQPLGIPRQGNQIKYEVTVEDSEVLAEPWVMAPRIMRLTPNADAGLLRERGNCEVYEEGVITSQIRH